MSKSKRKTKKEIATNITAEKAENVLAITELGWLFYVNTSNGLSAINPVGVESPHPEFFGSGLAT